MPNADDALNVINRLKSSLQLEWINTGRISDDWKVKLFEQSTSGLQFAIYKRMTSICVLLEREAAGVAGVTRLPKRPKSDSLKKEGSKFVLIRNLPQLAHSMSQ